MLVFIDESGCPGFKFSRGSDPIFAIGMVVFQDVEAAARAETVVRELHRSLPHRPEFKFSKTSHDIRDRFFRAVSGCDFKVFAVVVRKELVYSNHLRTDHDAFYSYFVKLMLGAGDRVADARIRLDGSGGREFKRALSAYLRKQLGTKIRNFDMVDSERDHLAQLADMCIGAVARCYRDRTDHDRWKKMLGKRIANIWPFH